MGDEPMTKDAPPTAADEVLAVAPELLTDAPLGGDVDEYGERDGAVAFVRIAGFPTEAEAIEVARYLVEGGVGATVATAEEPDERDPDGVFGVHVLPDDRRRAAERLGLVEVEDRPEASPVDPIVIEKGPIPWKIVLPIFAAAMIVIPLAAGVLTYLVMSR